jgi:hypothetical protein
MANYLATYTYTFRDKNGDEATMSVRAFSAEADTITDLVTSSDALNTIIGNAGTLSNAKVVRRGVSVLVDVAQTDPTAPNPPLDAEFPSVTDKAHLSLANAGGSKASVSIPAPIEAVFQAPPSDGVVNPSNAAMAAFIAGVTALARDAAGNPLNLYEGGTRVGSRQRLRRGKN